MEKITCNSTSQNKQIQIFVPCGREKKKRDPNLSPDNIRIVFHILIDILELYYLIFLTSLLEYNCFTMLCYLLLYNKVNQPYVYIYPHKPSLLQLPPTLPIPPLQVVTKHQTDLPVLCSCFTLAIYFILGSVYMSMPHSHFVPAYHSPTSTSPFSSSVSLFLSCSQVLQNLFFLDSIYMCQHVVFVLLFLTYFTLQDRLQVHPPHYK